MGIEIRNLSFSYDNHVIFQNFSLSIPDHGIVAVMGASGSGKTTLLRLLCGLLAPDSGEIVYPKKIRSSFIFQEDRLLPWYSAMENLNLVTGDAARSISWLARVGLAGWENAKPARLSGGMRRRVSIARALACPGDLLLMDEPFKGLDIAIKTEMMALIREACRNSPGALVTHDDEEAAALAGRVISLT